MKARLGVDSRSKVATPANVADSEMLPDLLHGKESRVWGDLAHRGQSEVIKANAPNAKDFINRRCRHQGVVDEVVRGKDRIRSRARAKVEHAIGVIKRVFGFTKVRHRGLDKNTNRLFVTCALASLYPVCQRLLLCQEA